MASGTEKWGSSPRVLLPNSLLWYRSAIVLEEASSQDLGVWARFVLFTSSLPFCRFSTLLTRYVRRKPVDCSWPKTRWTHKSDLRSKPKCPCFTFVAKNAAAHCG